MSEFTNTDLIRFGQSSLDPLCAFKFAMSIDNDRNMPEYNIWYILIAVNILVSLFISQLQADVCLGVVWTCKQPLLTRAQVDSVALK